MTILTRQEKERLVLDLYYNQGKTYREISKEVRISPHDIRVILNKADEIGAFKFISHIKQRFQCSINPKNRQELNRLGYFEDWENNKIKEDLSDLHKLNPLGLIHRKDWE